MSNLAVRTLLTSYIDLINSETNNEEKRSMIHLFFPIAACVSIPCHFGREIDDLRSISLFGETRRAFDEEFSRYRIEQGFWRATKKKRRRKKTGEEKAQVLKIALCLSNLDDFLDGDQKRGPRSIDREKRRTYWISAITRRKSERRKKQQGALYRCLIV